MGYLIFDGETDKLIGKLICNHRMTDEEICDACGIKLAKTQEDFEGMPENGMYDLGMLAIVYTYAVNKEVEK